MCFQGPAYAAPAGTTSILRSGFSRIRSRSGGQIAMRPSRAARTTASVRLCVLSLPRTVWTWNLTVCSVIPRRSAICLLPSPWAINRSTSCSRRVSCSTGASCTPPRPPGRLSSRAGELCDRRVQREQAAENGPRGQDDALRVDRTCQQAGRAGGQRPDGVAVILYDCHDGDAPFLRVGQTRQAALRIVAEIPHDDVRLLGPGRRAPHVVGPEGANHHAARLL